MEQKTIRWAIVGLGKISRRMLKVIRSAENSTVVACVSSSKERAEAYSKKYGIERAYTYNELAENSEFVDAVYICTHMNAHAAPAIMNLRKKLPVLCEKAIATTVRDAEAMIAAAKENDTLFMEAMWTRFEPANLYLIDLLNSGACGAIKSTRGAFEVGIGHGRSSRVFNRAVGGGSLLDIGVYPTTYTHMLLGVPETVAATGRIKKEVDVNCNTVFTYNSGVTAQFRISTEFMTLKEYYIIECEKATIKVPSFFDARKIIVKYNDGRKEVKKFGRRGNPDGFIWEILHFNDLVRRGKKESPIMTHKVTMEVMQLLEAQMKAVGVEY